MIDLLNDINQLTTIPRTTLDRLVQLTNTDICHCVEEQLLKQETITDIDIGIGRLLIKLEGNEIFYKFIPSTQLEKNIITTIKTKESPLIQKAEKSLVDKIENVYKELIQ